MSIAFRFVNSIDDDRWWRTAHRRTLILRARTAPVRSPATARPSRTTRRWVDAHLFNFSYSFFYFLWTWLYCRWRYLILGHWSRLLTAPSVYFLSFLHSASVFLFLIVFFLEKRFSFFHRLGPFILLALRRRVDGTGRQRRPHKGSAWCHGLFMNRLFSSFFFNPPPPPPLHVFVLFSPSPYRWYHRRRPPFLAAAIFSISWPPFWPVFFCFVFVFVCFFSFRSALDMGVFFLSFLSFFVHFLLEKCSRPSDFALRSFFFAFACRRFFFWNLFFVVFVVVRLFLSFFFSLSLLKTPKRPAWFSYHHDRALLRLSTVVWFLFSFLHEGGHGRFSFVFFLFFSRKSEKEKEKRPVRFSGTKKKESERVGVALLFCCSCSSWNSIGFRQRSLSLSWSQRWRYR